MVRKVHCVSLLGIRAHPVIMEIDSSLGLPGFSMVGLPDNAVREARERVVSALRSAGFQAMGRRITVNLAPADQRKEGSSYDLALAIGMLLATEQLDWNGEERFLFLAELSLDGSLQPVRGVLSAAFWARKCQRTLVVSQANLSEASAVEGVSVVSFASLTDCVSALQSSESMQTLVQEKTTPILSAAFSGQDFACVQGLPGVRRVLEIAAAGWHHFLMCGSPGSGKTLSAQCVPGILTPWEHDDALETTMIHSCAGLLEAKQGLLQARPFRAPHHSASAVALVGGGSHPRPGEVSLAHHGLLFLDELPEFSRATLEGLREPLESGLITVSRARESITWPARFLLGAAMNPCPCGYLLDTRRVCTCSPMEVARYRHRISGPLLDRIDLQVQVPQQSIDVMGGATGESSEHIRARVFAAMDRQKIRNRRGNKWFWNSALNHEEMRTHCWLTGEEEAFLKQAGDRLRLSARSLFRVLKVSRTIADLRGDDKIRKSDLLEAIQYRLPEGRMDA